MDGQTIDGQRRHWQRTFVDNHDMYGTEPSAPGRYAVELFSREHVRDVLELGGGQGRDTRAFAAAKFHVTALDYEANALELIRRELPVISTLTHDARELLPFGDASFNAVYSHMLFNMALSTVELEALAGEVRRVLRPGGWHIYTVRHTGDAHYGAGIDHGDGMFENGGFIVHFFDRALVERLAAGLTLVEVFEFEEGALPRKLWRVTLHKA